MDDLIQELQEKREEDLGDERENFEELMERIEPFTDDEMKAGSSQDASEWTDSALLSR